MGFSKYTEDNLEMFYERMAMSEYTSKQEYIPQQKSKKKELTSNEQKERDDEFRAMFAGESCFFW